jgi:hypothetical protein
VLGTCPLHPRLRCTSRKEVLPPTVDSVFVGISFNPVLHEVIMRTFLRLVSSLSSVAAVVLFVVALAMASSPALANQHVAPGDCSGCTTACPAGCTPSTACTGAPCDLSCNCTLHTGGGCYCDG